MIEKQPGATRGGEGAEGEDTKYAKRGIRALKARVGESAAEG